MWKIGTHWIELWKLSDFVFLLFAAAWISSLLLGLVFLMKRFLEPRLHMGEISRALKFLLIYLLIFMPVLAAIILYKTTYLYIGPYHGEDGIDTIWFIGTQSISFATPYGNHWFFALVIAVWLSGFLFFHLYHCRINKIAQKRLEATSHPYKSHTAKRALHILKGKLKLQTTITLWRSEMVHSPFITGIFHPQIFFPESDFDEKSLLLILEHELIHYKRRDLIYRKILLLISELYWFNPLIFILVKYYIDANEMACDEQVLDKKTGGERLQYANLLVNIGQPCEYLKNAVSLTGYTDSQLERRLKNMLRKRKPSKLTLAGLVLLLTLSCPFTTFAAAAGSAQLQDFLSEHLVESHEEIMSPRTPLTEITEQITDEEAALSVCDVQVEARGATAINTSVSGKKSTSLGSVSVPANGRISVSLYADSSTSSFKVGYINSSGTKTYVSSSNGEIEHTFTISKAGTYQLYIENCSSKTISVSGSITVR